MTDQLDLRLTLLLLESGMEGYAMLQDEGVTPNLLDNPGSGVLAMITEHVGKYQKLPSLERVQEFLGVTIPMPDNLHGDTLQELIGDVQYRNVSRRYDVLIEKAKEYGKAGDIDTGLDHLTTESRKLREDAGSNDNECIAFEDLLPAVAERYEKRKRGERGIPSYWPEMDEQTLGWWPGDLTVFVARTGVGKTFSMLLNLIAAYKAGYKILFVSTEMDVSVLATRLAALFFGFPYPEVRAGKLGEFQEIQFKNQLAEFTTSERIIFTGGRFDYDINSIERVVELEEPDYLMVDGAYLIKNKLMPTAEKHERVAEVVENIKRVSKRNGIASMISTQFNREVKMHNIKTASLDKIGLSDAIGQVADNVVALLQTDDMRKEKKMLARFLKLREGEQRSLELNWDFDNMDFSCVDKEQKQQQLLESNSKVSF